jgi:hypothetical protein
MPVELAEYLRHLAVRCCRLSRETGDQFLSKELETISTELVERAETVEELLKVPNAPAGEPRSEAADIVVVDSDDVA